MSEQSDNTDAEPQAAEPQPATDPTNATDLAASEPERPTVGPKILGVAEEKELPVVKQRLKEKPKREPLPWPELRRLVATVRDDTPIEELKAIFRSFPQQLRDDVTESVRNFQKGARRPLSQHAAKQLARATHTARRMKKNTPPSAEIAAAIGQALAAELIASLEPEQAAQVILPKRDLLERESRNARRRQKQEEDQRRDQQRKQRRESNRSSSQQTSFGAYGGAKIHGLDQVAEQLFGNAAEQATNEQETNTPSPEGDAPTTDNS